MNFYTDGRNTNLSNCYALSDGTKILSGADMYSDTYKVPGNYYCVSNDTATTLKNCPLSSAFVLKVDFAAGNSYPRQTFLQYDNKKSCARTWDDYNNRWFDIIYNLASWDFEDGEAPVTCGANETKQVLVRYAKSHTGYPHISVNTGAPGNISASVGNVTNIGFTICLYSKVSATYTVYWSIK